jgi:uncharacterized CHY-type Zn-finger protein
MIPKIAEVRGMNLDPQTRCQHYYGTTDIIAIKMKCCGVYYACKECHEILANHPIEVWPQSQWDEKAVLCGSCGAELTIRQYMQCGISAWNAQRNSIRAAKVTITITSHLLRRRELKPDRRNNLLCVLDESFRLSVELKKELPDLARRRLLPKSTRSGWGWFVSATRLR